MESSRMEAPEQSLFNGLDPFAQAWPSRSRRPACPQPGCRGQLLREICGSLVKVECDEPGCTWGQFIERDVRAPGGWRFKEETPLPGFGRPLRARQEPVKSITHSVWIRAREQGHVRPLDQPAAEPVMEPAVSPIVAPEPIAPQPQEKELSMPRSEPNQCVVPNCTKSTVAHGLCANCVSRWYRAGKPDLAEFQKQPRPTDGRRQRLEFAKPAPAAAEPKPPTPKLAVDQVMTPAPAIAEPLMPAGLLTLQTTAGLVGVTVIGRYLTILEHPAGRILRQLDVDELTQDRAPTGGGP